MARYAKVFDSIWDRSLRGKSDAILVFINILTHVDADGIVNRHWQTIVDETGLSQERVLAALTVLESPDPESNTPDHEGRRLRRLAENRSWGWEIVNHAIYRDLLSKADNAERQRRWRRRNADVTDSNATVTIDPDGDGVSDVDAESPSGDSQGGHPFDIFWNAYPRKVGKIAARKAWDKAMKVTSASVLFAAIEAQKRSEQWVKDGGQYIPHPATWLNQGRWDDEPTETRRKYTREVEVEI